MQARPAQRYLNLLPRMIMATIAMATTTTEIPGLLAKTISPRSHHAQLLNRHLRVRLLILWRRGTMRWRSRKKT
jgi:hypothetical protein